MAKEKNNRRARFLLLIAAMVMLFAVPVQAQASAKSTYKKGVTYYKNGKYSKARKQFKKLSKNANEKCVKNMSSKMKKAYLKTVKKYPEDNGHNVESCLSAYYLTDMDKDGKAELVVRSGSGEANFKATVYKYKGGKAKKIGSFGCGHSTLYYDPRGGLTVKYGQMSGERIYTVKIKNGKLKTTYWLKDVRDVSKSSYMYLPYYLDPHLKGNGYGTGIDYSALK